MTTEGDVTNRCLGRRAFLEAVLLGAGPLVLLPAAGAASPRDPDHHPVLQLPALAENPTAVPLRVSVEHPMEPDHFIRSIEIVLATDPVPHKGTYRFTPDNGQAWVAFPMRSGSGGLLTATAECSRHGRFVGAREVRVAGDGCASESASPDRSRLGHPRFRIPRPPKPGETVEVWAKVDHDSDTGLSLRAGKYVRERPEFFVKQMRVDFDGRPVSDFRLTSALSANPIIRFPLRVSRSGVLRVVFVNNEGRRWEVVETVRVQTTAQG